MAGKPQHMSVPGRGGQPNGRKVVNNMMKPDSLQKTQTGPKPGTGNGGKGGN